MIPSSLRVALLTVLATASMVQAGGPALDRIDPVSFPQIGVSLSIEGATMDALPTVSELEVTEGGSPVANLDLNINGEPVAVAMVLDRSGSMRDAMDDLRSAARSFVDELPSGAQVQLMAFSDRAELIEPFARDRVILRQGIDRLRPEGATALMDALLESLHDVASRKERRRILVAFTDGKDQNAAGSGPQSKATAKAVVLEARKIGVPLYILGLGPEVNQTTMAKMATLTGGTFLHAPTRGDLSRLFRQVNRLLKASFALTYISPRPLADGTERAVRVVVKAGPLAGQAKGSYTAPSRPVVATRPTPAGTKGPEAPGPKGFPGAPTYKLVGMGAAADAVALAKAQADLSLMATQHWTTMGVLLNEAALTTADIAVRQANVHAAQAQRLAWWAAQDALLVSLSATISATTFALVQTHVVQVRDAHLLLWTPIYTDAMRTTGIAIDVAVDAANAGAAAGVAGAAVGVEAARAGAEAARAAAEAARIGAQLGVAGAATGAEAAQQAADAAARAVGAAEAAHRAVEAARQSVGVGVQIRTNLQDLNQSLHELDGPDTTETPTPAEPADAGDDDSSKSSSDE